MKRLIRNKQKAMLGGVCAGFADHFNMDVSVVRILVVLITLLTAVVPAAIIYLITWLIMPEN